MASYTPPSTEQAAAQCQMTGQLISVHMTYQEAKRLIELLKDARVLAWKLRNAIDQADREREAWPS